MIKVEHLNYIYQKGLSSERPALKDVSFEISDGEFVSIIGHTGSGKSTLIQHLNGLIKTVDGKIYIDGEDISDNKCDIKKIRKKVGLVFQYPEHQLFEETVYKDIAFGPKKLGLSETEIKNRIYDTLEILQLDEDILEMSPFDLSGGQKRKVAIAGVLSMKPKILILDEPTAGLDPRGKNNLLNILKRLNKELKMTVILVSHSMEDVAKISDRIIVLNKGTVFMNSTVSDVFSHGNELKSINLDVPQITLLIEKLNEMGADLPKDVYTVDYAVKTIINRIKGQNNV